MSRGGFTRVHRLSDRCLIYPPLITADWWTPQLASPATGNWADILIAHLPRRLEHSEKLAAPPFRFWVSLPLLLAPGFFVPRDDDRPSIEISCCELLDRSLFPLVTLLIWINSEYLSASEYLLRRVKECRPVSAFEISTSFHAPRTSGSLFGRTGSESENKMS